MTIRQEKEQRPLPAAEKQGFYYSSCLLCFRLPTAQGQKLLE